MSRNLLVRSLSGAYVDLLRNVPLLLQLFMWYFVLTEMLPPIEEALQPAARRVLQQERLAVSASGVGARPLGHARRLRGRPRRCVGLGALGARAPRRHRPAQPMFALPALVILVLATADGLAASAARPSALDTAGEDRRSTWSAAAR